MWTTRDYTLLIASSLSHHVHELRWDPFTAYEFVTVGTGPSVAFWLLEEGEGGRGEVGEKMACRLRVHEPVIPRKILESSSVSVDQCFLSYNDLYLDTIPYIPHQRLCEVKSKAGHTSLWGKPWSLVLYI